MKERTRKRLDEIDDGHDWRIGQTYSSGGTHYYRTDRCRFCGLERRYDTDPQNGRGAEWSFSQDGESVPLSRVQVSCEGEA